MMNYDPIRILIVDDDEDDYLLVSDLFGDIHDIRFELDWARSYGEALDAVAQRTYDAYIFDNFLGEHSGIDLLRELIAQGCQDPIIMLTGVGNRELDLEAMEAGATDYLVKSQLNADLLERSIRFAMMQKHGQEALRSAHEELEERVQERTAQLAQLNASLEDEIAERKRAETALQQAHDDLERRVQERTVALRLINELLQLEVDQRKQSEHVLRESEAKHRALLDAIPDAMITIGQDGTVLEYKTPHDSMLPQPSREFPVKTISDLLPSSFTMLALDHVDLALQTGDLQVFEYQLSIREQRHDFEARVLVSGQNEVLCILRDITERKRIDRLKAEFLSVVSHELRTPLTSISGSLALIAAGVTGELPPQALTMIQIAQRNSERLVRLINDLLDLQKIESGTMPLHIEPVEVLPLVEQALEANYAYGSRYGVDFVLEPNGTESSALWVEADADRLTQVVTNLLSNAAKFSPAGSTVVVEVGQYDGRVRVSVCDEGPGIPEEYQALIFEKFKQVDASSSRQKEGTGLGLSISKAIIEMHGGHIGFETEVGRGSTFYFDLPQQQAENFS